MNDSMSNEASPAQGSAAGPAEPARGASAADHRNPFTRLLERRLNAAGSAGPAGAADFVERWDRLEALVIAIYRRGEASEEERAAFDEVAAWLARRYPALSDRLAPHWRGSAAGSHAGVTTVEDPFRRLFEGRRADSFAGDREALRTLPAAREAVNRWLLEQAGEH
jgi:hypothetical protein